MHTDFYEHQFLSFALMEGVTLGMQCIWPSIKWAQTLLLLLFFCLLFIVFHILLHGPSGPPLKGTLHVFFIHPPCRAMESCSSPFDGGGDGSDTGCELSSQATAMADTCLPQSLHCCPPHSTLTSWLLFVFFFFLSVLRSNLPSKQFIHLKWTSLQFLLFYILSYFLQVVFLLHHEFGNQVAHVLGLCAKSASLSFPVGTLAALWSSWELFFFFP